MSTPDPELELVMLARSADLPGGLHVRRAIPQAQRRMVGPFVFVDQMGPATFAAGREFTARLMAGSLFGASSGVRTSSLLFYAEAQAGPLVRRPPHSRAHETSAA